MSIDQRIREGLRSTNGELPTPDVVEALASVTANPRGSQGRALAVGLAAAAVVAAVVGGLALTREVTDTEEPIQTPTSTSTDSTALPAVNGTIQSTEEYLTSLGGECNGCYWPGSAFDQGTGRLVVIDSDPRGAPVSGIRVFGPEGLLSDLSCPRDFTCPASLVVAPGPGPDAVSVLSPAHQVTVLGYDGAVRRTVDVSPAPSEDAEAFVTSLAWSPDGERLALTTRGTTNGGAARARVWLVGGGRTRLLHTASSIEELPRVAVSGTSWSPDGSRLGFVEEHWNMAAEFGRPDSEIASSTSAVTIALDEGAATTLYEFAAEPASDERYDGPTVFLWSPDGERVALRVHDQVLELSAQEGTVLAEHPFIDGLLIWPGRQQ